MSDMSEIIKVVRSATTGKHTITVTVKLGVATSSYSVQCTQSSLKEYTELCRKEALKNLEVIK